MFNSGRITLWTGNDDLREGSQVWMVFKFRGNREERFDAARGQRFPDRTPHEHDFAFSASYAVTDLERIDIQFVPNRRDWMEDDKWWFTGLVVRLFDAGGEHRVYDQPVAHKFVGNDTWSTGRLPTYTDFPALIRVSLEDGRPAAGAMVYNHERLLGRTNVSGELLLDSALAPTETLIARLRVHEQNYYRSAHGVDSNQNWNFRVHLTNLRIDGEGLAQAERTSSGAIHSLVVRNTNVLIGVNVLLTTEFPATMEDLRTYRQTLADCSAYLYNATDGQFFIEWAVVVDEARHWNDSDYRVMAASNAIYRANVPNVLGGFLGWNILGSAMLMARNNDHKVYAHEFGHYGLALGDEYADGHPNVACSGNLAASGTFGRNREQASCMMHNQWAASKICSHHPANPHVRGTRQGDETCWQTIQRRYGFGLRSPVDRGGIPGRIRFGTGVTTSGAFMRTSIQVPGLAPDVRSRSVRVITSTGLPIAYALVKTRTPAGAWLEQDTTDEQGRANLVGTRAGDRIRVERLADAYESSIPEEDTFDMVVR